MVLIWCPECGKSASLPHSVRADGVVHPSVVCPYDGCSFHRFVHLAGWDGGDRPKTPTADLVAQDAEE